MYQVVSLKQHWQCTVVNWSCICYRCCLEYVNSV